MTWARKSPLKASSTRSTRSTAPKERKPKAPKPPKPKKCAMCPTRFVPRGMQKVCGVACALALNDRNKAKAEAARAKIERADIKARKEKLKTRNDWIAEAQVVFNRFIRLRDEDKPCICCGDVPANERRRPGRPAVLAHLTGGSWDAGHYRSVGSAPHLRFVEDNVHRQRKQCNRDGAGRAVEYRIGLIARIGLARVEALEADQAERKYTIDDLKALIAHYKQRIKELTK